MPRTWCRRDRFSHRHRSEATRGKPFLICSFLAWVGLVALAVVWVGATKSPASSAR
jgi:hypothetical protein